MKKVVSICLEAGLYEDIERIRGLVSRSAFIENMLKSYLYGEILS